MNEPIHSGIDLEFTGRKITAVGVSTGGVHQSHTSLDLLFDVVKSGRLLVGHAVIEADRPLINEAISAEVPLARFYDTMLMHYMANAELCKGSKAQEEDEHATERGAGYMDLWTMASLYTRLPNWKRCRGSKCVGPCRVHDFLGYNSWDSLACDLAFDPLCLDLAAKIGDWEPLHTRLRGLSVICGEMKERGIKIDLSVVRKMKAELDVRKDQLFPVIQVEVGKKKKKLVDTFDAPFNPRSPVQAKKWFKEHGVILADTSKEEIEKALERSSLDVDNAVRVWLERLYDYKDTGKDLGAWFEEGKYIDAGFAHPRFIVCGSSLGRLASSGPNFQNIPRVGWGRGIRAAIVPRDPALKLVKADSSQLEFRMCAWHAGVQESPEKVFEWLQESFPTVITNRDRAKSVVHAADYGEGVKIVGTVKGKVQAEVDAGCRILHRDWEYGGGWMSFTGINLARRLLGTASRENRVAVLAVQKAYFHRFPELRSWQKRVSQEAENKVIKSSYTGRRIELIGDAETNFKVALAKYGQGDSADYNQEGMQRFYGRGWTPLLQAHDEIVLEVPREMGDNDSRELMQLMAKPSTLFPGFQCPVKVSVGENWLETRSVE